MPRTKADLGALSTCFARAVGLGSHRPVEICQQEPAAREETHLLACRLVAIPTVLELPRLSAFAFSPSPFFL